MGKNFSTIFFMVIITTIFISSLAFIHESTKARISQNLETERNKSILYAFNILPEGVVETELSPTIETGDLPWNDQKIVEIFNRQIKKIKLPINESQQKTLSHGMLSWQDSVEIYIRLDENKEPGAFGFLLKGKGLWGTISAFGVISSNLSKMVGIDFLEQVETPGLGARILETEFKYFFRNLNIAGFQSSQRNIPVVVMVKQKDRSNLEEQTNSLQAITGATLTCDGVIKMINTDLAFYINFIKENEEVIRKWGTGAVEQLQ